MKASHRMWMFNEDGAKLFEKGDEIPKDYVDSPDKVDEEAETRQVSAAAKVLADKHGIDIEKVIGTGAGGNVTKSDIEDLIE